MPSERGLSKAANDRRVRTGGLPGAIGSCKWPRRHARLCPSPPGRRNRSYFWVTRLNQETLLRIGQCPRGP